MYKLQGNKRTPLSVFISYAHEDELLRQQLEDHLSLLRRQGLVADWHDRQIMPGAAWAQEIDEHLEAASIILLLISASFLASDYCYEIEMQRALEYHKRGKARVIPIILRPCDWRKSPFAHLQCLPRDGKAVTIWQNSDEAFLTVAQGLRQVIEQQQIPLRPLPEEERKNRTALIKQVRTTWIEGLLEHSLHEAARLELRLQEQPDASANPWRLQVQELDRPPQPLPPDTSIVQVYDEADGELLILGEPGAGKTTLLLELARTLLDRAEADEHHRIPVVFNLSSWAEKRSLLAEWLVEELWTKYRVPRKIGQSWMDSDQLLPLLDGLDEVAEEARSGCVQTINAYYQHRLEQGPDPLVVCCRSQEYMALSTRITLPQAVSIQPLMDEQIEHYLQSAGKQLEAVQAAIHKDPILREFATTPLMLSILVLTYQGKSIEDLVIGTSLEDQRRRVLTAYVQRMLQRRSIETRYTRDQTTRWLAWLAWQLVQHNQTQFYIERMQPDWLPDSRLHRLYYGSVVRLGIGLTAGLIICFSIGMATGLLFGKLEGLVIGLAFGLVGGLTSGLAGGLAIGLMSQLKPQIQPAEVVDWSWRRLVKIGQLKNRLVIAIGSSILISLPFSLIMLSRSSRVSGGEIPFPVLFTIVIGIAVITAVGTVLANGLTSGVSSKIEDERNLTRPNQGIRRSARTSILIGLVGSLIGGIVSVAALIPILLLIQASASFIILLCLMLLFASLSGTISGLVIGLPNGGVACIQHIALRLLLWRSGLMAWNYPGFLDYAAERILLRKVGGGYIFVHRLLLDYFASLPLLSNRGRI